MTQAGTIGGHGRGAGGVLALLLLTSFGIGLLAALPTPALGWVPHPPIIINGNLEFTPANGVTAGTGTPADPYIIEGWEIDGSANSGIEVYNTDVHFVIRDVYVHSSLIDAIFLYSVRNARIENATVSGNDGALYIQVSSNVTVAASNVSANNLDAIVLDYSNNVTIEGNAMWNNGDWGVFTFESEDLVIRGNTISTNGWAGIELDFTRRALIEGNIVANHNVGGIILDTASNVTIVNNTVPDNDFNIDLTDSVDVLIRNNTVATSTSDGITITGGTRLTVEENNITGNGGGLLAVGVTGLLVRHNAFFGNLPQAADNAGANAWDDGYPSGGNYWSDYAGVDNCTGPLQDVCTQSDGIGDTPYVIDADSRDRYPVMVPFGTGAPGYTVTIIPPLPGDILTIPWGVNETGAVVGWSTDGSVERPFLYTDALGTVPLLLDANRFRGTAREINDAGVIVGGIYGPDPEVAVRWSSEAAAPQLLGILGAGPFSHAWGVNATGAVVGWSDVSTLTTHGFLYTDAGGLVDITPNSSGQALDINDAGRVTGWAVAGGAFRWSAGNFESLGVPGGLARSFGYAINEVGQVAGCAESATGNTQRITRFTDGVGWEILGGAGDTNCAWGINAYGDVVGFGRPTGTGIIRSFLYTDAGGMQDLERMIDPALLLRILDATDINDRGQIVGYAWDNIATQYRGVRLDPVTIPPPNRSPTATVVSPNSGQVWSGGSPHSVSWTMADPEDGVLDVAIDLSTDGGTTYPFPLFSGALAQGANTIPWAVPTVDSAAARVRVCVTDSDGASACDASDATFRIDSTAPQVSSTIPMNGATGIDPNADVVVVFSESMNRSGAMATFSITPDPGPATKTFAWSTGSVTDDTVTVALDPLAFSQTYQITIGCSPRDLSDPGNPISPCPITFSFTTAAAPVPPAVTVTAPAAGERWTGGSSHSLGWTATDADTPGPLAVDLSYSTDGGTSWTSIAGPSPYPQGANAYSWSVPMIDSGSVLVRACASDGALSGCGASPAFAIDATAPFVSSVDPPDGSVDVPLDAVIHVTFSEAMDETSLLPPGLTLVPAVASLVPSWTSGSVLAVGHAPFAPCTTYTAALEAGVEDASDPGIALPARSSWTFSTVCPPTAAILDPAGGEDWTGGSARVVRFVVGDDVDTQVSAWLNATLDGVESPLFAGLVLVGETTVPWTLPRTSATATLSLEVADGNGLGAAATTGSFTIDGATPTLVSTSPSNLATDTDLTVQIVLTFSEPMAGPVTASAVSFVPSAGAALPAWDPSGTRLTITFAAPLLANTSYALSIGCGAKDDSDPGNPLAGCGGPAPLSFRTELGPPLALATAAPQVRVGEAVTLDGRGSTGSIVSWAWTVVDSRGATVVTLSGPMVSTTFPTAGMYRVDLRVTDSRDRIATASFEVLVVGEEVPWVPLALFAAAVTGGAALAATEPGRVAIAGATVARLYGRKPKDEKDSEIRGAIRGYIQVHPGDCYMDIKRNLALNDGVVTYHLGKLERERLIRSVVRGARKRYYPTGMNVPAENGGELHEVQQRLLRLVAAEPGMPVAFLAEQLGVSEQLALYHLRRLAHANQVGLERRGLRLRAFPRLRKT